MKINFSEQIYNLAKKLWPINRSITGDGVRETLSIIQKEVPELKIFEIPSGTKVFDWTIPKEWRVRDAYIVTPSGEKICQFKKNNLHLIGYSSPINLELSLSQLQDHLYSLPDQPSAIPYITSYYEERWGFCITHEERKNLQEGDYKVSIDSELFDGSLTYGEILIKGQSPKEIFISTYICHPSMANDNLSSIAVQLNLIKYLKENYRNSFFSYRFVFLPETIGSICYLSKKKDKLKKNMMLGFALSCLGDDHNYSLIKSRNDDSLSNYAIRSALIGKKNVSEYEFLERGSDERQYCYPGIDLPLSGFCRSKFHNFKEYHTDQDNLNYISELGLKNSFEVFKSIIDALENRNFYPKNKFFCEPNLGKRGLMSTIGKKFHEKNKSLKNFLAYSDGEKNLFEISNIINLNLKDTLEISKILEKKGLI